MYACADEDLAMKIATAVVEYILRLQEEANDPELPDEDRNADADTRDAIRAITEFSEGVSQYVESLNNES
jgi:hypothetical protein